MNKAQQNLVCAGAVAAALLGYAAVREMNKTGLNCRDNIVAWTKGEGRLVQAKMRVCK